MAEQKVNAPLKQGAVDRLQVQLYSDRAEMGMAAGLAAARDLSGLLAKKDKVVMVFAAAPSQAEFLETLAQVPNLDWSRVIAFHLDEYVGLEPKAPQGFGNWLRRNIFDKVSPGEVYFLQDKERYEGLLRQNPIDIACIGIGENGHIAFNDPPVADFQDPHLVKVVELDPVCRQQQVNDGCFQSLELVPTHALTMTVPAIMAAAKIHCMVPGPTKANAVKAALEGPIETHCPASALRRHPNAILYIDSESGKLLKQNIL